MSDVMRDFPGLEPIRQRFRATLADRQSDVAHHALEAWNASQEGGTPKAVARHLKEVRNRLHTIAGSAGSLGYGELGEAAFHGEAEIISYLEREDAATSAAVPADVIYAINTFIERCGAAIDGD
ncbi:Hpt domain-containing protein [Rhodobacteraceae bacterium D3-12]|nr:Hpt domain-containing protein [Rhodobacteraceae bacterium D3-12]